MPLDKPSRSRRDQTPAAASERRWLPYEPDYGVPPGDLLDDYLSDREISAREFARRCGRSPKLIVEILAGKAPVEPETALQFEKVLDVSASVWLNIESAYRLQCAKVEEDRALAQQIAWARDFPLEDMYRLNIIERQNAPADTVRQLLRFFEAGSVDACKQRFAELAAVSYRHSPSFKSVEEDLLVWLRLGELKAHSLACDNYDRADFMEALHEIRALTFLPSDEYLPRIQSLCAKVGVAFVVQGKIGRVALSGISRWLSPRKAIIQQTLRHKRNDHFWFTFFHEAAHLLHHSRKSVFIDTFDKGEKGTGNADEEREANEWATNFLIPQKALENFILEGNFEEEDVCDFADEQGIAPGIVVGQLQNRQVIGYNKFSNLFEKIEPSL